MSWNATAYEGLKKIEALGAEVHYTENTPASAGGDAIRTFADDGYNVIFLSSNSYQAVSYTHLDVYKRQPMTRSCLCSV